MQDGQPARTSVADKAGRLTFSVDLGAPHTTEQSGFYAGNEADGWTQATVSIQRVK